MLQILHKSRSYLKDYHEKDKNLYSVLATTIQSLSLQKSLDTNMNGKCNFL